MNQNETPNQEDKNFDRRKALEVAAVGIAGLLIGNSVSAQNPSSTGEGKTNVGLDKINKGIINAPAKKNFIKDAAFLKKDDEIKISRTESEDKIWQGIKSIIEADYSISAKNRIEGGISTNFLKIESGFKFTSEALDEEFIITHIEPLLDQAADLLDRCLRDRSSWDELSIKALNLALELKEYLDLDVIHQEEEAAGVYETASKQSESEYFSEQATHESLITTKNYLNSIINTQFSFDKMNEIYLSNWVITSLNGVVPYDYQNSRFSGYVDHTRNGITKKVWEHSSDAAAKISWHDIYNRRLALEVQREFLDNQIETSQQRLSGLKAKAEWDKLNSNFLRRRTLVARHLQDLKTKSASDPDGILNYIKRLIPLKERYTKDFRDSLARLKKIYEGLKIVYGVDLPLPIDEANYDDHLIWVRSTIQRLIKFARRDLNTVYPVSVRELLGKNEFNRQRKSGIWNFNFDESDFKGLAHIRLRGISASVLDNGNHSERLWQFLIQPPVDSKFIFLDNSTSKIDQSFIQPILLGRVVEREAPKVPDIAGLTSLYNCSPIGKWTINALGCIPSRGCEKIEDIQIDLQLAYRWNSSNFANSTKK